MDDQKASRKCWNCSILSLGCEVLGEWKLGEWNLSEWKMSEWKNSESIFADFHKLLNSKLVLCSFF